MKIIAIITIISISSFALSISLFSSTSSFAQESPPVYNKPYAPIFTDKDVYTWTDKVKISIHAPSWNANRHAIDTIGSQQSHSVKISTRGFSLEPYKLTETDFNSGIFTGEVTLTGFSHDANGDGTIDTNPITTGSGPTNGFLETTQDSAVTISFEFADGVVLTHSANISWNIGVISFLEPTYLIDQKATVRVVDPDMNLNPEATDQITVDISSDSDRAGITVSAVETNQASGIFESSFFFTQNLVSSGNRLFAIPDDIIYARYDDNTLPRPFSTSSNLQVETTSDFKSNLALLERIILGETFIADSSGLQVTNASADQQTQVVGNIHNNQNYNQDFIYFVQITDDLGTIVLLSWIQGELSPYQSLQLSQSWSPPQSGNYIIETFVWDSLQESIPFSSPTLQYYTVL